MWVEKPAWAPRPPAVGERPGQGMGLGQVGLRQVGLGELSVLSHLILTMTTHYHHVNFTYKVTEALGGEESYSGDTLWEGGELGFEPRVQAPLLFMINFSEKRSHTGPSMIQ